jgi:hypothetical protein
MHKNNYLPFYDALISRETAARILAVKSPQTLREILRTYQINELYPGLFSNREITALIIRIQADIDKANGLEEIDREAQKGIENHMLTREEIKRDFFQVKAAKTLRVFEEVTGLRSYPVNPFNPHASGRLISFLDLQEAIARYKDIVFNS